MALILLPGLGLILLRKRGNGLNRLVMVLIACCGLASMAPSCCTGFAINDYYVVTGHLGEPLKAFDVAQNLEWETWYTPFGKTVNLNQGELELNFRLPGQYYDAETSEALGSEIYYNWNRYYMPEVGRYLQPDPVVNPVLPGSSYSYGLNNPLLVMDLDGEEPITLLILGGAAIGLEAFGAWYANETMDKAIAYGDPELANDALDAHVKNTYCSLGVFGGGIVLAEYGPAIASTMASSRFLIDETGGWNSKTLQTGGHTLRKGTLKALNLTKEQGQRAIEGLKDYLNLPPNFHQTKIMSNGDVLNSHTGELLGNLYDFKP